MRILQINEQTITISLIRNNQLIFVEDINLSEIVQVTDNSSLNREIYDAGWGEFVRQLEYKAEWYGRTVIKVPGGDKPMTAKEVLENGLKILSEDAVQEEA